MAKEIAFLTNDAFEFEKQFSATFAVTYIVQLLFQIAERNSFVDRNPIRSGPLNNATFGNLHFSVAKELEKGCILSRQAVFVDDVGLETCSKMVIFMTEKVKGCNFLTHDGKNDDSGKERSSAVGESHDKSVSCAIVVDRIVG